LRRSGAATYGVIAGLDSAIHLLESILIFLMDARVKPAHDEQSLRIRCERS
jgi:hypothetical protein